MDAELLKQIEDLTKQGWKLCAGCKGCSEDYKSGKDDTWVHRLKVCDIETRKFYGIPPKS